MRPGIRNAIQAVIRAYPQVAVSVLGQSIDDEIGEAFVFAEVSKFSIFEFIQSIIGPDPEIVISVHQKSGDRIISQSIFAQVGSKDSVTILNQAPAKAADP